MSDIVPEVRHRDLSKYNKEATFESLDSYLTIAKKIVKHFCSQSVIRVLLRDEDAMSEVANAVMEADWRWEEGREGGSTKHAYRNKCALWKIRPLLGRMKKNFGYKKLDKDKEVDSLTAYDVITDRKSEGLKLNDSPLDILIEQEDHEFLLLLNRYLLECTKLTDTQRNYLSMRFLDGMGLKEIAEITGTSPQNVQQCIASGITKVQSMVKRCTHEMQQ